MKRRTLFIIVLSCVLILYAVVLIPAWGCNNTPAGKTENTTISKTTPTPEPQLQPTPTPTPTPTSPPVVLPKECIQIGCKAPGFTLESTAGKIISLSDFRGRRVFVNFWPDASNDYEDQFYLLQKVYDGWSRTAVEFLIINTKADKMNLNAFMGSRGLTIPVLLDKSGDVTRLYQGNPGPVTYIIDALGYVAGVQGYQFSTIDEVDRFIGPKPCTETGNKIGNKMPDFTLKNLDDKDISLSSLRGKKTVLMFLQTGCESCRAQMKYLQDAIATKSDRDWSALLIAIRDSKDYVKRVVVMNSITLPTVLDSTGEVSDKIYMPHLPCTFFLNEYGCIRNVREGYFQNFKQISACLDY
jgi:peroxiredoxin